MYKIAIDGPGGAGKSSLAKAVAKELGIIYVDTGALYRSIGLYAVRAGVSPKDRDAVVALLPKITLELKYSDGKQSVILNGEDVGDSIRTPEISMAASDVSAIKEVRDFLLKTQRDIAAKNSVIMDGRDIGTVILPDAEVKIFLTASPEARAKRRYKELLAKGQDVKYEDVYSEMVLRDKNDSTRDVAPCVPAKDAIMLDNSKLTPEKTVKKVLKIVKKKTKTSGAYMFLYSLLGPGIRFFQRIKTVGLENVPKEGGVILCPNHIAWKDVILIGSTLPRQIRFVAKKELFNIPILGWLIKTLGAVKLDRGGADVSAIKKTVELAKSGEIVAIFPQGHRYPAVDPSTTPTKNGAGMVAYRSGCDVIPVFINTKNNKYHFFGGVEIIFGKPIKNSELGFENGGSAEYKAATDLIFSRVLELGGYSKMLPETNKTENEESEETEE